ICGLGLDGRFFESLRLGNHVRIKSCTLDIATARPESNTAHFVGIRLSRNRVGPRSLRSPAPRKPRHGKIKASPEEMHRAAFADEPRPELAEDRIHRQQNP